jgi:hypothetical protein
MPSPSYKRLYLQEKQRRELYERWDAGLALKYEHFCSNLKSLRNDIESAMLQGVQIDEPRTMRGLLQYTAPVNPAKGE